MQHTAFESRRIMGSKLVLIFKRWHYKHPRRRHGVGDASPGNILIARACTPVDRARPCLQNFTVVAKLMHILQTTVLL